MWVGSCNTIDKTPSENIYNCRRMSLSHQFNIVVFGKSLTHQEALGLLGVSVNTKACDSSEG